LHEEKAFWKDIVEKAQIKNGGTRKAKTE